MKASRDIGLKGEATLSNDQVKAIAQHFVPDAALKMLTERLPAAVDPASPNGEIARN